jgi:hypothetical protein
VCFRQHKKCSVLTWPPNYLFVVLSIWSILYPSPLFSILKKQRKRQKPTAGSTSLFVQLILSKYNMAYFASALL